MKEIYLTGNKPMDLNRNMENEGEKPGVNNVDEMPLSGQVGSLRNKLLDIAVPGTVSWDDAAGASERSKKEQEEQNALEALIGSVDPEEQRLLQEEKEKAIKSAQRELDKLKGREGFRVAGGADIPDEARKLVEDFREGKVPASMTPSLEQTLLISGISPEDIRTKTTNQLMVMLRDIVDSTAPDNSSTEVVQSQDVSQGPEKSPLVGREGTWKNQDHDQPVIITGSLGVRDGREYVSIEGSTTGIPLDEIELSQSDETGHQSTDSAPVDQDPAGESTPDVATGGQGGDDGSGKPPDATAASEDEPNEDDDEDEEPEQLPGDPVLTKEDVDSFKKLWVEQGLNVKKAEEYAKHGLIPLPGMTLEESMREAEIELMERKDPGLDTRLYEWLEEIELEQKELKKLLENFKDNVLKFEGKVTANTIDAKAKELEKMISRGAVNRNDANVRMARAGLRRMLTVRRRQEEELLPAEQRALLELKKRGRGGYEREDPYAPPKSLEDLLFENVQFAPIEYRIGQEKALLYVKRDANGNEIVDPETGKKVYRVNFENFTRYIHELAVTRGAVSPRSAVNYFGVLKLRKGYNQFSLEDVLLYDETATLFLPNREPGESPAEYDARTKAYKMVRDNLSSDLWIRQNDREKHIALEYSGNRGNDEQIENEYLKTFNDNVQVRSDDMEKRLNLSNALSFSPEKMETRIKLIMTRDARTIQEKIANLTNLLGVIYQDGNIYTGLESFKNELGLAMTTLQNARDLENQENMTDAKNKELFRATEYIDHLLRALDDNFDGQIFRQGFSIYAHMGDFDALNEILSGEKDGQKISGQESVFFKRFLVDDPENDIKGALPTEAQDFVKGKDSFMKFLLDYENFPEDWFDKEGNLLIDKEIGGKSVKALFLGTINMFNDAGKPVPVMEAIQERVICALAQKAFDKLNNPDTGYRGVIEKKLREKNSILNEETNEQELQIDEEQLASDINKELWKDAFDIARYNHEDSYYWTSIGGVNAGDNDPGASAYRAMSKVFNTFPYIQKQLDPRRGQYPGNPILFAGVERLSIPMAMGITTVDRRSFLDVFEGREFAGDDTFKFNFDGRIKNVVFRQDAMSFYADNHIRRVMKWFRNAIDSKDLNFASFIRKDTSELGAGRFIIDQAKADTFFGALKDWRYVFNELPTDLKIRVIVGEKDNGEFIYKEITVAEALFTDELLHEYKAEKDEYRFIKATDKRVIDADVVAMGDVILPKDVLDNNGNVIYKKGHKFSKGDIIHHAGDEIKRGDFYYDLDVAKGEIDQAIIAKNKGDVWKSFAKYFIMSEILSHRIKDGTREYYDPKVIHEIMLLLENIPAAIDWGQSKEDRRNRSSKNTRITQYFLSDEEIEWIRNMANSSEMRVTLEDLWYSGGVGGLMGLLKMLAIVTGVEDVVKMK